MPKFRKKPIVIEATQWFKNGDHPQDESRMVSVTADSEKFLTEGKVVRYYRKPGDDGQRPCEYCKQIMHVHGWIDTKEGGHIVCPGDFIITGVQGERYPCKPDIFAATYEDEDGVFIYLRKVANIWAMEHDGGIIGLRFDSGDAGYIPLTPEQAQDVIDTLAPFTPAKK